MCLPAVYKPALMVEWGWGNISFHHSDTWVAANVGTQKVTTKHITEKDNRNKTQNCTDANDPVNNISDLAFSIYSHF